MTKITELLEKEIYCDGNNQRETLGGMVEHLVSSNTLSQKELKDKQDALLSIIYDQKREPELRALSIQLLAEVQDEYQAEYEFAEIERVDSDTRERISRAAGSCGLGN